MHDVHVNALAFEYARSGHGVCVLIPTDGQKVPGEHGIAMLVPCGQYILAGHCICTLELSGQE
jgi:hypothetical protein